MKYLWILSSLALSGCIDVAVQSGKVKIVSIVSKDCKNLGPVATTSKSVDPTYLQNILRQDAADLGGNTLVKKGEASGTAYSCPTDAKPF